MKIRLNKFLSHAGVTSRREADRLIAEGRVSVNGEIVQSLGCKVEEEGDRVVVDGRMVSIDRTHVYVMLNKPVGYLVTMKDTHNRPTVMQLIKPLKERVFPVGRLDLNSHGLLLLTNDGELANQLMHPRYQIKKEYEVIIKGVLGNRSLKRLERGVVLDGKKTVPARVTILMSSRQKSSIRIQIHEGRKREIRRMMEAVGSTVLDLKRVRFAGLSMGKLKLGQWRHLTEDELSRLKKLTRS